MSPVRKVCPECGAEHEKGYFNCQKCGASLRDAEATGTDERRHDGDGERHPADDDDEGASFEWETRPGDRRVSDPQKVIVTDVRMDFWSMVVFMVKWSIATIPALIILVGISAVVIGIALGIADGGLGGY